MRKHGGPLYGLQQLYFERLDKLFFEGSVSFVEFFLVFSFELHFVFFFFVSHVLDVSFRSLGIQLLFVRSSREFFRQNNFKIILRRGEIGKSDLNSFFSENHDADKIVLPNQCNVLNGIQPKSCSQCNELNVQWITS